MNWKTRKNKAWIRKELMRGFTSARALMLPGPTCEDIKVGIKQGVFDQNSEIVGVERDPDIFRRMKTNGTKLPLRFDPRLCNLEKVQPEGQFDLFGLDLCGSLTASVSEWLRANHTHLKDGGRLLFTMQYSPRGNQYLRQQMKRCKTGDWKTEYEMFVQNVPMNRRNDLIQGPEFILHKLTDIRFRKTVTYAYRDGTPMLVFVMF
jgi:hypothetical protein